MLFMKVSHVFIIWEVLKVVVSWCFYFGPTFHLHLFKVYLIKVVIFWNIVCRFAGFFFMRKWPLSPSLDNKIKKNKKIGGVGGDINCVKDGNRNLNFENYLDLFLFCSENCKVLALRAMLKDQVAKKQVSTGYTDVSGEETVESTSIPSSDKPQGTSIVHQIGGECNYALNVDDYSSVMMTPYNWASLPSCP